MASVARCVAGLALVAVLVAPSASACHPAWVESTGVVADESGPTPARIAFPLGACEGTVDVSVTLEPVAGEATTETLEAQLDVHAPEGACLPWNTCMAEIPPAAHFSLTSADGRVNLTGVAVNNVHTTQVVHLTGTYAGDGATFTIAKPL